jgi:very-short-patch-repair endonuclease
MSQSEVYDHEALELLERSIRQLGQIYSVIEDSDGEVLAGRHRLQAGATKKTVIDTQKIAERLGISRRMAKLMIILHSNVQRRVSREETREIILEMAKELEKQGIPKEKIASELYKKYVPYSERYIRELLPDEYKQVEKRNISDIQNISKNTHAELVPHDAKVIEKIYTVDSSGEKLVFTEKREEPTPEQIDRIKDLWIKVNGWEPPKEIIDSLDRAEAESMIEYLEEELLKRATERITDEQFNRIVELREKLLGCPIDDTEKQYLKTLLYDEAEAMIRELESQLKTFRISKSEKDIQQQIHSPVSRMDLAVPMRLNELGITNFTSQEPICVYQLIPDLVFHDKKVLVFFDGPGHKHDDLEAMMREAMTRRGWRVLEIEYEKYSKQEVERIVKEILEFLGVEINA